MYWDTTLFSNGPAVLQQRDLTGREARWKLVVSARAPKLLASSRLPIRPSAHPPVHPYSPSTLDPSSCLQFASEPPGIDHPIELKRLCRHMSVGGFLVTCTLVHPGGGKLA